MLTIVTQNWKGVIFADHSLFKGTFKKSHLFLSKEEKSIFHLIQTCFIFLSDKQSKQN